MKGVSQEVEIRNMQNENDRLARDLGEATAQTEKLIETFISEQRAYTEKINTLEAKVHLYMCVYSNYVLLNAHLDIDIHDLFYSFFNKKIHE